MNQLFKQALCFSMLTLPNILYSQNQPCQSLGHARGHIRNTCLPKEHTRISSCGTRTLFLPRSQGFNYARRMAGWQEIIPGCDDRAYGNAWITVEHTHSFRSRRLAQYFFGSNCLHFVGSQVSHRNPKRDIIADYFGLPTTFVGKVCFKPRIKNWIVDLNFHIGLDNWIHGLYFKAHAPIVVTKWDLGLHCNEINNITFDDIPLFPQCYMSNKCSQATNPNCTALTDTPPTASSIRQALAGCATIGDREMPLMFGKFICQEQRKSGLANLAVILGWNFLLQERAHFGLFTEIIAPTGNKPQSETIFEPIVGNGDFWQLGGGISAHGTLFAYGCQSLEIYFEGSVTRQLKTFQIRSFDLCQRGSLSRYMLLKEFNTDNSYTGRILNAVDFTTRGVRVGGSIVAQAAVKLVYYNGRFGAELGYEGYARTGEHMCLEHDIFPSDLNNKRFGIKGTEGVCYRILDTTTDTFKATGANLQSTQNRATITNSGPLDNPASIILPAGEMPMTWNNLIAQNSQPPVILTEKDLDIRSGLVPKQATHKAFAHISYTYIDKWFEPQFGIGGEIEFDAKRHLMSSLNQWGIWFKVGVSY